MPSIETINSLHRLTALLTLFFLSLQIYIKTTNVSTLFKNVVTSLTFLLIFIQPLFIILVRYIVSSEIDPFYMYTDLCVLCDGKYEYYVNFLRIAFYSVTIGVMAPVLISINKWFKTNWKLLLNLYYVGFYSLSLYLYNTGPIVKSTSFFVLSWICQGVVLYSASRELKKIVKGY